MLLQNYNLKHTANHFKPDGLCVDLKGSDYISRQKVTANSMRTGFPLNANAQLAVSESSTNQALTDRATRG